MGIMATTGDVASATTSTIGALTAAAAGTAIGAIEGAVKGFGRGLGTGATSTPIAVLGLVGIGAAGIIDWPILLAGGAAALLLRQFRHTTPTPEIIPVPVAVPDPVTVPANPPPASTGVGTTPGPVSTNTGAAATPVPARAPRRRRTPASKPTLTT